MAEYHAYDVNPGWIGMPCKHVPGCNEKVGSVFRELFNELERLYPQIPSGSVRFESDSEPHFVRYIGSATGAPLHTDTEHMSLTVNVLLSDPCDFGGGGTYLKVLDRVIRLNQGEVLVHPGNLLHAGADITYGVRQLLVAFLECEWESDVGGATAPPL